MEMVPFIDASSSSTIYINPLQVLYCTAHSRQTAEGQAQTIISFLKGRDFTVLGAVDEVAVKLMAQ